MICATAHIAIDIKPISQTTVEKREEEKNN
jgi:hypothetical protein